MPTLKFASVFEVDYEVVDVDTVKVAAFFVVPGDIPKAGRFQIGETTLSPKDLTRTFSVNEMVGQTALQTGFSVSVTVSLDVVRSTLRLQASALAKMVGKHLASSPWVVDESRGYSWPKAPVGTIGSGAIAHVVVVMMENRSFDSLVGWLYTDTQNVPARNIPSQITPMYDGLKEGVYWNPREAADVNKPDVDVPEKDRVYVARRAADFSVPDPDPHEQFRHMNYQLFGTETPGPKDPATMKGFVVNYANAIKESGTQASDPDGIMQCFSPEQLPVLSALARNYAICDRWFASVPCQTLPNRAFVHAGTSCGRVNNLDKDVDDNTPPNPFHYNTKTIFNVLKELGVTWKIYVDGIVTPSLTRYQFITQLSDPLLAPHFRGFNEFQNDAALGTLPSYSFVEPSFIEKKNDQHPPHDVAAGDRFLYDVWKALSTGSAWENTLLIITYDEHGGCYDHVPPPWTAVKPDDSTPQKPFEFDRYGVRVPTVVVSPWIEPGTVFRSGSGAVDYDHTSILATLRDWQDLAGRAKAGWLGSKRIEAAPTLGQVLTRTTPRTDTPEVPVPELKLKEGLKKTLKKGIPLNSIQSGLAAAALMGSDKGQESYHKVVDQVAEIKTAEDALDRLRKEAADRLSPSKVSEGK